MAQVRDFKMVLGGPLDGEWDVTGGDFNTVADAAAVPQGIDIRVSTLLGDVWLDETLGVDWLGSILGKTNPIVVRGVLAQAIAETPDVNSVVGADIITDPGTREASASYDVDTVYSDGDTLAGAVESPV